MPPHTFFQETRKLRKQAFLDPVLSLLRLESNTLERVGFSEDAPVISTLVTNIEKRYAELMTGPDPKVEKFLNIAEGMLATKSVKDVINAHRGYVHYLEYAIGFILQAFLLFTPNLFGYALTEKFQFPFLSDTAKLIIDLRKALQYMAMPIVKEEDRIEETTLTLS